MIKLREVKSSDKPHFQKWWTDPDLIALTSGDYSELSDSDFEKYFNEIISSKLNYHFMIENDDKTIGHISLSERDNNWYEIQIVIGEKDEWGKGYGTISINELLKFAKIHSIKNIYLEVRPENIRAIKAYEKCGFLLKQTIKFPGDQNLFNTLRMEYRY